MRKILMIAALAASASSIAVMSNQASAAVSAGSIVPVEKIQKVNESSFQIAWSLSGAAKKVGKAAKSVGKTAGKAIGKVDRVVVPSEIRRARDTIYNTGGNAASKAAKGVYEAGLFVAKHPYGRRCKPDKYLRPVCTVKGTGSVSRDHRSQGRNTVVPARLGHRTGPTVRDHRTIKDAPKKIRDHRTLRRNEVVPARSGRR